MQQFRDSANRAWSINLNVTTVKRVRDLLQVNLLEPEKGKPPLLARIGSDEILLCDIIYVLCKDQADAQGITDEQFGAAMGGDAILAAQDAFYQELMDFFRQRGRSDRAQAVAKQLALITRAIQLAHRQIESIDLEQVGQQMEQEMAKISLEESISGRPSISSPASSVSIPGPSP